MRSGKYIMGSEVSELEDTIKEYTGCKYAITCANGTDALILSLLFNMVTVSAPR